MSTPTTTPGAEGGPPPSRTRRRDVLVPLSGLLMALFVAILSSTIVSNALPRIISELGGTQAQYTWVVTASLLAMTASTPIWGKLADLFSKKLLVQIAITIFVVGSMLAGLSQTTPQLIGFRVVQGLGMGGLMALAQVVIAAIIPPRERGRYAGYLGAVMAVATVGGPLIGGVLVDTVGWRWCFYVAVPIAVAALVVLHRTLAVPTTPREVHIDYPGALLIAGGVSALLIWISLGGSAFAWVSWASLAWAGSGVVALALALVVESRAREPIVPLGLFRDPTVSLATVAALFVGVAMFGASVFLAQFFQLARGASATEAGLLTLPLIVGLFLASTVVGQLISRFGRWKPYLVAGGVSLTVGLAAQGLLMSATAPYWWIAVSMALVGLGVGALQQNLVLAVQNQVAMRDMGAASSTVAFFRSLGGAAGVAALGALLSTQVSASITSGLAAAGVPASATSSADGAIPDVTTLPGPVRAVVENAYGDAMALVFLAATPLALIALIAVLFLREVPLRETIDLEQAPAEGATGRPAEDVSARVPSVASSVRGVVRNGAGPAAGAVLTVIDPGGRQIARALAAEDGSFHLALDGEPHLLLAQYHGAPHVESLGGTRGALHRDITLPAPAPGPAAADADTIVAVTR